MSGYGYSGHKLGVVDDELVCLTCQRVPILAVVPEERPCVMHPDDDCSRELPCEQCPSR